MSETEQMKTNESPEADASGSEKKKRNRKEKVKRYGLMGKYMKGNLNRDSNMEKVAAFFLIIKNILENLQWEKMMERENLYGKME